MKHQSDIRSWRRFRVKHSNCLRIWLTLHVSRNYMYWLLYCALNASSKYMNEYIYTGFDSVYTAKGWDIDPALLHLLLLFPAQISASFTGLVQVNMCAHSASWGNQSRLTKIKSNTAIRSGNVLEQLICGQMKALQVGTGTVFFLNCLLQNLNREHLTNEFEPGLLLAANKRRQQLNHVQQHKHFYWASVDNMALSLSCEC